MKKEDIVKNLKKIIVEQLGVEFEEITENASFINDFGADSLDQIDLLMAVGEEFDFEISDKGAEKVKTFGEAVEYIEKRLLVKSRERS